MSAVLAYIDREFARIEAPLDVRFDSPEDARALVLYLPCPHLQRDPAWTSRLAPAVGSICEALNAAPQPLVGALKGNTDAR